MTDKKISGLTSASTPLAGTEVLPIVQSGATVKTTVADIVGSGTYQCSFTLSYCTSVGYSEGAAYGQYVAISTTAYNASPVAGLIGVVKWNSSGNTAGVGAITFEKDNTTDGNYSGSTYLWARTNGFPLAKILAVSYNGMTCKTIQATAANGFISSDSSYGISTTITAASLAGKTITVKDGIITGFA